MSSWPHTFATQYPSIALSWLDDQFNRLSSASTSTVSLSGAALVGFTQAGSGAVARTGTEKLKEFVTFEDFGATGDGVTDDSTAIDSAISYVSGLGGGWIRGNFGKTYAYNSGALQIQDSVKIDLNQSTLLLNINGNFEGVQLRSNTILQNGAVTVVGSNLTGTGGNLQCPIVIGQFTSNVGYQKVIARNLAVTGNRADGNCILVTADSNAVSIENIVFPTSTSIGRCVVIHWAGDGSVPPALTTHPYNILVRNIVAGDMTNSSADQAIVFVSGAHNIDIKNVFCTRTQVAIAQFAIGDYGYKYASASVQPMAGRNVRFSNLASEQSNTYGFYGSSIADNYAGTPIYRVDVEVDGITSVGDDTSAGSGIRILSGQGFRFKNANITKHKHGCEFEQSSAYCSIDDSLLFSNRQNGVDVGHSTIPHDHKIRRVTCYGNGTDTGAGNFAGVYVINSSNIEISDCALGDDSGETIQNWGFYTDSTALEITLLRNYVNGIKSSGFGFTIGSSTDYGILRLFSDNSCNTGLTNFRSGVNIVPVAILPTINSPRNVRVFRCAKAVLTAGQTPTAGTWQSGDTIYYDDPSAGGNFGTFCVAGGSPGTWKLSPTIAA